MEQSAKSHGRWIAVCCAAIIAALYVVGMVSHTSLRHVVQTAPLWLGVILGAYGARVTRWIALPFFVFWLGIMILIWLYLTGIAQIVSGTFSPTEIAMTLVIGLASLAGIVVCLRAKQGTSAAVAVAAFLLSSILQFIAFRVSQLPGIARR